MSVTRRDFLGTGGYAAALLALRNGCTRADQSAATDLAVLDAVETAARIRSGDVSAAEVIDAAIERAVRINPAINAIARKTFRRAQHGSKNSLVDGPFAGVPTFIKDLDDITGVATGFGSRAFPFYRGQDQTPLVSAFLATGAMSLGKSTTPEFGLSGTTESIRTGATRNPWNTDYSCGGSSGGAGALVAFGVVPIAHASDGGGSIRIPASCCGNIGLKVTRGRHWPARDDSALPISLTTHGAQTRTVRDTAAITLALEQPSETSGLQSVGLVNSPINRSLRIGYFTEGLAGRPVEQEVVDATERVAALCNDLGHHVDDATPLLSQHVDAGFETDFQLYWASIAAGIVSFWKDTMPETLSSMAFEPFTLGLAGEFDRNRNNYESAVARLQSLSPILEAIFEDYDVLLSPVLAAPPPKIGYLDGKLDYETLIERLLEYVQFTALYNVTGGPAISLPLSMSRDHLPIGAMFAAPIGGDRTLIELAYQLEAAAPWASRRPPVFG